VDSFGKVQLSGGEAQLRGSKLRFFPSKTHPLRPNGLRRQHAGQKQNNRKTRLNTKPHAGGRRSFSAAGSATGIMGTARHRKPGITTVRLK
jgi:hypothetical protein